MTENSDNEKKTHHQHLLMAPSEVAAIDDWGFTNRIRTRGEAIRRLCQIGLAYADREEKFSEVLHGIFVNYFGLYSAWQDDPHSVPPAVAEHIEALAQPVDDFFRLMLLLGAENIPLKQTADMEQALAEVKDLRSRMVGFTRASLPGDPKPED